MLSFPAAGCRVGTDFHFDEDSGRGHADHQGVAQLRARAEFRSRDAAALVAGRSSRA